MADGQTAEQTLAERIAHIESNPLLVALSAITDLGTCGGKGGLQRALEIAIAAIEADFKRPRPEQFYIVWNGARNEGFVTEDESDAIAAVEAYGDDPVTLEEITLVVDKVRRDVVAFDGEAE